MTNSVTEVVAVDADQPHGAADDVEVTEDLIGVVHEVGSCPVCGAPGYEYDYEFKAWVCDACGLWREAPEPDVSY